MPEGFLIPPALYGVALEGETLYMLVNRPTTEDVFETTIFSFDLITGERSLVVTGRIEAFALNGGDLLLLLEREAGNDAWIQIHQFDIQTKNRTFLKRFKAEAPGFLLYWEDEDAALYSDQRVVKRLRGGNETAMAYLLPGMYKPQPLLMPDGTLAVCSIYQDITVYALSEDFSMGRPLRVEDDGGDHFLSYQKAYPRQSIDAYTFDVSGPAAFMDLLSGTDETPDIFIWWIQSPIFEAIKSRGFILNIDENDYIRIRTEQYHPLIRQALSIDGQGVYAVPMYFWLNAWVFRSELWQKTMGTCKPPQTFLECLDLMQDWDNEEIRLICIPQNRSEWLTEVLRHYILQTRKKGQPLSFNRAAFRRTLEAIAQIEDTPDETCYSEDAIFYPYCSIRGAWTGTDDPLNQGEWICPFRIEPDAEPKVPIKMRAYIVHNATQQKVNALAFMEYVARYEAERFPQRSVLMTPGEKEPVLTPGYEHRQRQLRERLADMEEALGNTKSDEKWKIHDHIESLKKDLADESDMWWFSEEQLRHYRKEIEPYLDFDTFFENDASIEPFTPLFDLLYGYAERYVYNALSLDDTITGMDRLMMQAFQERIQ